MHATVIVVIIISIITYILFIVYYLLFLICCFLFNVFFIFIYCFLFIYYYYEIKKNVSVLDKVFVFVQHKWPSAAQPINCIVPLSQANNRGHLAHPHNSSQSLPIARC